MATQYSITIINKSFKDQSFMLFQSVPKPANVPQDNVFTNVYQFAPSIVGTSEAEASFSVTNEFFAVYGTSKQSSDGKVKVSTSDSRPAKLGPDGSNFTLTTINKDGRSPKFESDDLTTQAGGAFVVRTDQTFDTINAGKIYFGIGAKDPNTGKVVPIQTYQAQPNVVSQIFPKIKYYVAFGNYVPGTIVSMDELGAVLSVDFTGAPGHDATFVLDDHNNYTLQADAGSTGVKWSTGPAA